MPGGTLRWLVLRAETGSCYEIMEQSLYRKQTVHFLYYP
jgi:hypothetical protein